MTKVTSISTATGNVNIDSDVLTNFVRRYNSIHAEIDANKEELKVIANEVSKATGLKKGTATKYLKQRYDAKTKETAALGELFSNLDEALDD